MSSPLRLPRSEAAPKVPITPDSPRRRFTQPLKDSYECPTCKKVLQIQTCDEEERGYLFGCKYVQCTHENTRYDDWPKKFQWVTEWYLATGDDDDDQEPAASKSLDPDNIAVYHLGKCTFGGCHWTKLHRDCNRGLCNFHCRATGNCPVGCHRASGMPTPSQSEKSSRVLNPPSSKSLTLSVSSTSTSSAPSTSASSTSSASPNPATPHISVQYPPITPASLIRTKATSTASFDPPVGPQPRPLKKKREEEPRAATVKRRRVGVIDLTPGSSRENPIDLDAE